MYLRILLLVMGLFFLAMGLASQSIAAEQSFFSPWTQARLADAAARGDAPAYNSAIIEEIARNPSNVGPIVEEAVRRAPGFRQKIEAAVGRAFPGFSIQIANALSVEKTTDTDRRQKPPEIQQPQKPNDADQPIKKYGWAGEIDIGGSRTTGNTEREQTSSAIKLTKSYPVWSHEINMTFDLARKDQETSARRLVTNFETRYDPSNGFYAFAFLQYEDDKFSGFDYELTESAGMGYRILNSKNVTWNLELGPGARQSVVSRTNKTETEIVGRGKSAFSWKISETAELSNDTTVIGGEDRTTTENTTALSTTIIGSLSARLSFQVRHNSNPPSDTESTDTLSKVSLAYGF